MKTTLSASKTSATGAFINTPFTIAGDSKNTIFNEGALNSGVTINGGNVTHIRNMQDAFVNGVMHRR